MPEKLAYKHLETDAEFLARVKQKYTWYMGYYKGEQLDDEVWRSFRMQRKIVEVFS